jgi:hypothetical protein
MKSETEFYTNISKQWIWINNYCSRPITMNLNFFKYPRVWKHSNSINTYYITEHIISRSCHSKFNIISEN